jgi:hypothetical protein
MDVGLQSSGDGRETPNKLAWQASLWQSPSGKEGGNRSRGGERKEELLLDGQAQMWGTPHGMAGTDATGKQGAGGEFAEAVVNWTKDFWATPTARDHKSGEASPETMEGNARPLNEQATHWSTPRSTDGEKGGPCMSWGGGGMPLPTQAYLSSLPVPATSTPGHEKSSPTTRTSRRRLNPAFVCWLMGLPWWWTNIASTSSGPEAMVSYRSRLQWHLSCLLDGLE